MHALTDSVFSHHQLISMFCLHVATDEDFACVKPPPSKKSREDVKQEHEKSSSKSSSQESDSQSTVSQKSR